MKNAIKVKAAIILIVIFSMVLTQASASASADASLQEESAKVLVKLGIMTGYPDGSLGLQNKIKRCEFFTLVVRMLGYDKDTNLDSIKLPFKDIDKSHWAYNNIKIAYNYGLIKGNPDNTIAPNNYITYPEVLAVMIRVLDYEKTVSGTWPENVINKAFELGINKNVELAKDKQVTRGETSVIVYNSLTVNFR